MSIFVKLASLLTVLPILICAKPNLTLADEKNILELQNTQRKRTIDFVNSILGTYQVTSDTLSSYGSETIHTSEDQLEYSFLRIYLANGYGEQTFTDLRLTSDNFSELYLYVDTVIIDTNTAEVHVEHKLGIKVSDSIANLNQELTWPDQDPKRRLKVYPYEITKQGIDPKTQTLFMTITYSSHNKSGEAHSRQANIKKITFDGGNLKLVTEMRYYSRENTLINKISSIFNSDTKEADLWQPSSKLNNQKTEIDAKKFDQVMSIFKLASLSGIKIDKKNTDSMMPVQIIKGEKQLVIGSDKARNYDFDKITTKAKKAIEQSPYSSFSGFRNWWTNFIIEYHRAADVDEKGYASDFEPTILGRLMPDVILDLGTKNNELAWIHKLSESIDTLFKQALLNQNSLEVQLLKSEFLISSINMYNLVNRPSANESLEYNYLLYQYEIIAKTLDELELKEFRVLLIYKVMDLIQMSAQINLSSIKKYMIAKLKAKAKDSNLSLLNALDISNSNFKANSCNKYLN